MNISVSMRSYLLTDIRTAIVTNILPVDRQIYFFGTDPNIVLCSLLFNDLINLSTVGNKASYLFSANDGPTLRNTVVAADKVKTFKIWGKVNNSDPSPDQSFITGSVGGLTSSADMKFNKVDWQIGQNITITNLYLLMK